MGGQGSLMDKFFHQLVLEFLACAVLLKILALTEANHSAVQKEWKDLGFGGKEDGLLSPALGKPPMVLFFCPFSRLRSVKMEQRKLSDQANTLVDLSKVITPPPSSLCKKARWWSPDVVEQ